jgi:AcrR family transcriptional regulator
LLNAAQELFAERGHQATTTKEIANRAGVSEDLIFRYYGSKDGLLQEAVLKPLLDLLARMKTDWEEDTHVRQLSERTLTLTFVTKLYRTIAGNRAVAMTLIQLLLENPEGLDVDRVRRQISDLFEPMAPSVDSFLEDRGLRRGDPALIFRICMIVVGASAAFLPATYAEPGAAPDDDVVIGELVDLMLTGLQPAHPED